MKIPQIFIFICFHINGIFLFMSPEKKIWDSIAKDYDPAFRPILNSSKPLEVTVVLQPMKIINIVSNLLLNHKVFLH